MYDLIIIGAGPAGLTAGIYAARYMLRTLVISELIGGEITEAHKVCNFPSQPSISGYELGNKMYEQAKGLGVEFVQGTIKEVMVKDDYFIINGYKARRVIIATGRKKRKLNVPGEEELLGRGVSYCATCDAAFFKNKVVAVIGGGNSALTAALLLSEFARKVYIIYRRSSFFRAEPAWVKAVKDNGKIESLFNQTIKKINGGEGVTSVLLSDDSVLPVNGVFIEIGSEPDTSLTMKLGVKLDKNGYVIVNPDKSTNINGLYAAGDVTSNKLKQVVTACADGAIAAASVYESLMLLNNE